MSLWCVSIGLNYAGTAYKLNGCINDCNNIVRLMTKKMKLQKEKTFIFTDNVDSENKSYPTKENIKKIFLMISKQIKKNDILYLHFSGHGFFIDGNNAGIITSTGGKIEKKLKECILLRNGGDDQTLKTITSNNTICDAEFSDIIKLFKNILFFGVLDCCNSGNVFDLSYNIRVKTEHSCYENYCKASSKKETYFYLTNNTKRPCFQSDILFLSAVKERQVSWDTQDKNGNPAGALTSMLLEILELHDWTTLTYLDLLYMLHIKLQQKYNQDPQLSFCSPDIIVKNFLNH